MAVVVLPTPPFWFAMQNTRAPLGLDVVVFIEFLDCDASRSGSVAHPAPGLAAPGCLAPAIRPAGARLESRLPRSEEHTSELQSLMRISYAVFCLKKKNKKK